MIKILYLIWRLEAGGIETICINILKNIDLNKFHIDFVLCMENENKNIYEDLVRSYGSKIYRLTHVDDLKTKKIYLKELNKILKDNKYDVVHAHQDFLNIATLKIARKNGVKNRISHCHNLIQSTTLKEKFITLIKQQMLKRVSTYRLGSNYIIK